MTDAEARALSPRQMICLRYLTDKMEANAHMIGEHILGNHSVSQKNHAQVSAIGGQAARYLRSLGFVTYLPDLKAWRITKAGRAALDQARAKER